MLRSMKVLVLLALINFCTAGEDVLELTDSNFEATLAHHDHSLVMFYAPWCGHCKKLKPEFAIAAGILKTNDPPVALVQVDCTGEGKAICENYKVSGYPTLFIFNKAVSQSDYEGPRESAGIVKFMRSKVGPSSKEIFTVEEHDQVLNKDEVVVVGYFKNYTPLRLQFLKLTEKLRHKIFFANSAEKVVLEKAGYENNVVLYRPKILANKFEESVIVYDREGEPSVESLEAFINENYHGIVPIRTKENIKDFSHPIVVVYFAVDYVRNVKGTNYWRNRILKVAKDLKGLQFTISNKDDFMHEINEFGLNFIKNDRILVTAFDNESNRFIMKQEFSVDNLREFAEGVIAGTLQPNVKTEEPVPQSEDSFVKVAVGSNFKEIVTDSGRDALVEFYAPWCGHCQKLTPIWDELAEKMKDEDVDIVKMDATANDWPRKLYDVKGFPTIYWKPKDSSIKPHVYSGSRDVGAFIKFIAENSSDKLKGFNKNGKEIKEEL